jgi:glucokinase
MTLALDIGGSAVRAARVGGNGTIGPVSQRPLHVRLTRPELRRRVEEAFRNLDPQPELDGAIGVAVPAFLDVEGRVRFAVNLPSLEGVELSDLLRRVAGDLPVVPIADVAAAALAEALLGAGRGAERFLCVSLGTGANAAMVVGGRLLETAFGCLGDAGHIVVEPEGPACLCGGRGCFEAVASGVAMARDGRRFGLDSGRAVVDAALGGDSDATAIVARAGRALGCAIASWAAILWPERVAVCGGLSAAADLLLDPAREEMRRLGADYIVGEIEIVPAAFGSSATLIGAGLFAFEQMEKEG